MGQILTSLEGMIIQPDARLVVVDSIASLVRKEFSGLDGGRSDFLAKEATLLKYIAASFQIPVLVTNQVTTKYMKESYGRKCVQYRPCFMLSDT